MDLAGTDTLFFTNEEISVGRKCDEILINQMTDNIYAKIGSICFDIALLSPWVPTVPYSWLICFCTHRKLNFKICKRSNKKLAKTFNSTSCYIDDLIRINPRFKDFLKYIYPEELVGKMLCHTWIC